MAYFQGKINMTKRKDWKNNPGFYLEKHIHLQKGVFNSVLCYDYRKWLHWPFSLLFSLKWKASISRDCRQCTVLYTDLQFSAEYIDCTLYFLKKPEIGRNTQKKKVKEAWSTVFFFPPPISGGNEKVSPHWNKENILQLVKLWKFFSLNYLTDFHTIYWLGSSSRWMDRYLRQDE